MTHLPYFNLYVGDEAAETAHLSAEEHGAYHRLRCHYWRHEVLPDDDERLRRITGVEPDRWPTVRTVIASLFDEGWRLNKLDEHRAQAEIDREKKSKTAREAARARWGNRPKNANSNADAYANAMPDALPEAMQTHMPTQSGRNAHQHQLKISALEEGTAAHARTRTHAGARETIPQVTSTEQAGRWLSEHMFPGDRGFDECCRMMVAGKLTWDEIDRWAA